MRPGVAERTAGVFGNGLRRVLADARSRVHARELFRMLKDRTKRMSDNFSGRQFHLQRAADKNYVTHRDVEEQKSSKRLYERFGICLLGAVHHLRLRDMANHRLSSDTPCDYRG
jgi:hypothetical protein